MNRPLYNAKSKLPRYMQVQDRNWFNCVLTDIERAQTIQATQNELERLFWNNSIDEQNISIDEEYKQLDILFDSSDIVRPPTKYVVDCGRTGSGGVISNNSNIVNIPPPPPSHLPKLKKLSTHEIRPLAPNLGCIFYINGHSVIELDPLIDTDSNIESLISDIYTDSFFEKMYFKSYMMFLKSFGESTTADNRLNTHITNEINTYLSETKTPNYSDLYTKISPSLTSTDIVCESQIYNDGTNCSKLNSLLRYLPIYSKINISTKSISSIYIKTPQKSDTFTPTKNLIHPADSHPSWSMPDKEINIQRFKPELFTFIRVFTFDSVYNTFYIFFNKNQLEHRLIESTLIDTIIEKINNKNLCEPEHNQNAIVYFSIYFIIIYQNLLDIPDKCKTIEDVQRQLYQQFWTSVNNKIDTTFLKHFFPIPTGHTSEFKQKYIQCMFTFQQLFNLQVLKIDLDSSIIDLDKRYLPIYTSAGNYGKSKLITTNDIILFNQIFKFIKPEWGNSIIISKSCNVLHAESKTNLKTIGLVDFFDNVELIPGKMRKAFTKRKTKSVNDKSKTSNRKIFFNKFNTPKSNARTHKLKTRKLKLKHKKKFISSSQ